MCEKMTHPIGRPVSKFSTRRAPQQFTIEMPERSSRKSEQAIPTRSEPQVLSIEIDKTIDNKIIPGFGLLNQFCSHRAPLPIQR